MICKTLQLPLASLNRWRRRIRDNVTLIQRPGPKKVEPFNPLVLDTEIQLLDHGVKRSQGTTGLYQCYGPACHGGIGVDGGASAAGLGSGSPCPSSLDRMACTGNRVAMDFTECDLAWRINLLAQYAGSRLTVQAFCRWLEGIRLEKRWPEI